MSDNLPLWIVNVNNGQRLYVVEAPTAGDACTRAGNFWRTDPDVSERQHGRGVYDIRASHAKFGQRGAGTFIPWESTASASTVPEDHMGGDDGPWHVVVS